MAQVLVAVLDRHDAVGREHQRLAILVEEGRGDGTKATIGDHLAIECLDADVRIDIMNAYIFVFSDADHLLPTSVQVHLGQIVG